MLDFSKYEVTNTFFGGSEKKIAINFDGFEYMIKFQKQTNFGERRLNHISEYIGSHIFELLGFEVQETYLGTYNKEQVVACKNFVIDGNQFVPFNDVGESSLEQDKEIYQYSYQDIMQMLRDNVKLTNVEETINMFWDIYVVDALIGNFDRHGSNWGFLKKNNKYTLAPVFDNGSSLYPQLTDESMMEKIMASEDLTNERIYKFPTSQVQLDGKKSSYFEVINSLKFKECNDSVVKICKLYSQEKIDELIDETPFLSDMRKKFYKYILKQRFEKILLPAYNKLMEK
ncbi:MAG: HipA domain-containing protein [Christensenellales bacterium]